MTTSWSGQRRSFPRRTARAILRRDTTCQLNWPGCTIKATQADHIVGHADATAAGWDPEDIDHEDNGQGVCETCHHKKTLAEQARGRTRRNPERPTQPHPGYTT